MKIRHVARLQAPLTDFDFKVVRASIYASPTHRHNAQVPYLKELQQSRAPQPSASGRVVKMSYCHGAQSRRRHDSPLLPRGYA
jgi:hypothetical protein